MHRGDEIAVCRGCGRELKGKPYGMGGDAYHPVTGERCPKNHYGGFVCSEECDRRASVEQHASMPGCRGARTPDQGAAKTIARNWAR